MNPKEVSAIFMPETSLGVVIFLFLFSFYIFVKYILSKNFFSWEVDMIFFLKVLPCLRVQWLVGKKLFQCINNSEFWRFGFNKFMVVKIINKST